MARSAGVTVVATGSNAPGPMERAAGKSTLVEEDMVCSLSGRSSIAEKPVARLSSSEQVASQPAAQARLHGRARGLPVERWTVVRVFLRLVQPDDPATRRRGFHQ